MYDIMLAPFNHALLDALDPRPGERVLDVGCGFGSTSLAAAARGAQVHGVDISPPMIQRARERAAEAGADATFAVADAQEDPLGGPYDAVTSRFGVMFFADAVRAFRNFASATRRGGRLAFVCWQPLERNPWMLDGPRMLRSLMDVRRHRRHRVPAHSRSVTPSSSIGCLPKAGGPSIRSRRSKRSHGWAATMASRAR